MLRFNGVLVLTLACANLGGSDNGTVRSLFRSEGECDVLLPCPTYARASSAWVINDTLLSLSAIELEDLFQVAYGGLVINRVSDALNGTTFHCVVPSGEGLDAVGGPVSMLTVESSRNSSNPCTSERDVYIRIDAQQLLFSNDTVTWAWKVVRYYEACRPTMFKVDVKNCSGDKQQPTTTVYHNNITLAYSDLEPHEDSNLNHVTIKGVDCGDCTCIDNFAFEAESMQLVKTRDENVGIGRDYCILFPTEASPRKGALHVLWPRSLMDRALPDCDCPVFSGEEFLLDKCSYFHNSDYTLEAGFNNDTSKYELCFKNLTSSMNETRVHLFYETKECMVRPQGFETALSYQTFIRSFRIFLREVPVEPDVEYTNGTLCVKSSKPSISDSVFLAILIHDVTDELVYDEHTFSASENCTYVGQVLASNVCAPYTLTVQAHNGYLSSATVTSTLKNNTGSEDICACIQEDRVQVQVQLTEDTNTAALKISCNNSFQSQVTLFMNISNSTKSISHMNFSCKPNQETIIPIQNLTSLTTNTMYSYTISWMSKNITCDIMNGTFPKRAFIDKLNTAGKVLIGVAVVFVVVAIMALVIVAIYCKKRRRRESYLDVGESDSDEKKDTRL